MLGPVRWPGRRDVRPDQTWPGRRDAMEDVTSLVAWSGSA